ncbi:TIGR00645 family protein [Agromyces sp. NPDC057679]|uniref:TIGR00645 family protein n=1 Tax=Agromyces sp. NPDC057679 TaxID=3346207 RepID=UPI00366E785C
MTTRKFRWSDSIATLIFTSRWLQAPLYLGLIVAQVLYVVQFVGELWRLAEAVLSDPAHVSQSVVMLGVLGLIDVVMIANLLIMVIIGGYETFVSKLGLDGQRDKPEWLSHVNSNVLKTKLAMSIIGISSIHLLKTFIEIADLGDPAGSAAKNYTVDGVFWQVTIHCLFILSALGLAWIDWWHNQDSIRDRKLRIREAKFGIVHESRDQDALDSLLHPEQPAASGTQR